MKLKDRESFFFPLEDNRLNVVLVSLLDNDVGQLYVYIYSLPPERPSQPLRPTHLGHHRAELLCSTVFCCCYFLTTHSEQITTSVSLLTFPQLIFSQTPCPVQLSIAWPWQKIRMALFLQARIWSRVRPNLFHSPVFSQSLVQHV